MQTVVQGRHYRSGRPVEITITGGTIEKITDWAAARNELQLPWIGPGLVDLQLNGYMGNDFNKAPIPDTTTNRVTCELWKEGVTSYYPTVITNDDAAIEAAVRSIARECHENPLTGACVAGIHLEGPFISPEDGARGAHNKAFVKAPDWELMQRWQEAAGGLLRIVTLSPEWPEAVGFIRHCTANGIVVSIGHTAASPEQIREAVDAGASMSTHFGNGVHPVLPRHPNYLWEQLASDSLWACVIADGYHLPSSVLKVVMKVKGNRMLLVSDGVQLSGMPPGSYDMPVGGRVVLTKEGRLHLADDPRLLAGSAQMLPWGMSHLVRSGLCELPDAWDMASTRPSAKMGLAVSSGLVEGAPADLLVLEWHGDRCVPIAAYKNGDKVYQKE